MYNCIIRGDEKMKERGFVTSALLYGILSVYIVLVVGTISVIGNRKMANDKIKQSAIDDVQNIETAATCFDTANNGSGDTDVKITNYKCHTTVKNVFIPEKDSSGNKITVIGPEAFKNKNVMSVIIKSNITGINCNAFNGNSNVLFIIKGSLPATITPSGVTCNSETRWGAQTSSIRRD